jgi:hypothetical protein
MAPRRAPVGDRIGRPPGGGQRWCDDPGLVVIVGDVEVVGEVGVEVQVELEVHDKAEVGNRFEAQVVAMASAVSIEECFAPSMRMNARRWVWASTTAMLLKTLG